jgi:hypothetical protein
MPCVEFLTIFVQFRSISPYYIAYVREICYICRRFCKAHIAKHYINSTFSFNLKTQNT